MMLALMVGVGTARADLRREASLELGVDSFAQIFRVTDEFGSDLLGQESTLRDTTDVFTEFRAATELLVADDDDAHRWQGRGRFSAGTDLLRGGLDLDYRYRPMDQRQRLDLDLQVDGRHFQNDNDFNLDSDTFEAGARAQWQRRITEGWELGLRSRGELLRYQRQSIYELDSQRADISVTSDLRRGWSRSLDLELGAGFKDIPDSQEISYRRLTGHALAATSLGDHLELSIDHTVERRLYEDADVRSHLWDFVLEPDLRLSLGEHWRLQWRSPLEWLDYDRSTSVYFDLFIGRTGLMLSRRQGGFELGVEPRWSWLRAPGDQEDEYQQPSVLLRADYFGGGRVFFTLSEEVGQRDYLDVPLDGLELYSDYWFARTTLLMSIGLSDRLRLDGFLSDEPESHRRDSDDSRLTLVTASLRWSL